MAKILFVCSGNQCRSPIGMFLLQEAFQARHIADFTVDSAGTLPLAPHAIDPFAAHLLAERGIDTSLFRSKPVTADISAGADVILCFERQQISDVIRQKPALRHRTFLFNDFVNLCLYLHANNNVKGGTPFTHLESIIDSASLVRPFLPEATETEDPHKKSFSVFERVFKEIDNGVNIITDTIS